MIIHNIKSNNVELCLIFGLGRFTKYIYSRIQFSGVKYKFYRLIKPLAQAALRGPSLDEYPSSEPIRRPMEEIVHKVHRYSEEYKVKISSFKRVSICP